MLVSHKPRPAVFGKPCRHHRYVNATGTRSKQRGIEARSSRSISDLSAASADPTFSRSSSNRNHRQQQQQKEKVPPPRLSKSSSHAYIASMMTDSASNANSATINLCDEHEGPTVAETTSPSISITRLNNRAKLQKDMEHKHGGGGGGGVPLQPQWALLAQLGDSRHSPASVECIKISAVNGFVCFIGADRQTCDLVLKPFTSPMEGRQVVLVYANGSFHLKDLNSSLGTFINDRRVPSRCFVHLNEADTIRFGFTPTAYRLVKLSPTVSSHTPLNSSQTNLLNSGKTETMNKMFRIEEKEINKSSKLSPSSSSLMSSASSNSSSSSSSTMSNIPPSTTTSPSKVFMSAMKKMKLNFKKKTGKNKSMICSGNEDITFIRYDSHTDVATNTAPTIIVKMNSAPESPNRNELNSPSIMSNSVACFGATLSQQLSIIYSDPIGSKIIENDYDEVTHEQEMDSLDCLTNPEVPAHLSKVTPDSTLESLSAKSTTTEMIKEEEEEGAANMSNGERSLEEISSSSTSSSLVLLSHLSSPDDRYNNNNNNVDTHLSGESTKLIDYHLGRCAVLSSSEQVAIHSSTNSIKDNRQVSPSARLPVCPSTEKPESRPLAWDNKSHGSSRSSSSFSSHHSDHNQLCTKKQAEETQTSIADCAINQVASNCSGSAPLTPTSSPPTLDSTGERCLSPSFSSHPNKPDGSCCAAKSNTVDTRRPRSTEKEENDKKRVASAALIASRLVLIDDIALPSVGNIEDTDHSSQVKHYFVTSIHEELNKRAEAMEASFTDNGVLQATQPSPNDTDNSLEPLSIESQSKMSMGGMSFVIDLGEDARTTATTKNKFRDNQPPFVSRRYSFNTKARRNESTCTNHSGTATRATTTSDKSSQANSFLRRQDNYRRSLRATSCTTTFLEKEKQLDRTLEGDHFVGSTTKTTQATPTRITNLESSPKSRRFYAQTNRVEYLDNDSTPQQQQDSSHCLWNNAKGTMKRNNQNSVDTSDASSKTSSTSSIRRSTAHLSESAVYLINRMFEDNDRHRFHGETIVEDVQLNNVCCASPREQSAMSLPFEHYQESKDNVEHLDADPNGDLSDTGTYTVEIDERGERKKKKKKKTTTTNKKSNNNKEEPRSTDDEEEEANNTAHTDYDEETGYEVDEEEDDDDDDDDEEVEDKLEMARKKIDELFSFYSNKKKNKKKSTSDASDIYQGANNATFTRTKKTLLARGYDDNETATSGDDYGSCNKVNQRTITRQTRDNVSKSTTLRKTMNDELVSHKFDRSPRPKTSNLVHDNSPVRNQEHKPSIGSNRPRIPTLQPRSGSKPLSAPSTPYMSGSENRKKYCPPTRPVVKPAFSTARKSSISSTDDRYTSAEDFDDRSSAVSNETYAAGSPGRTRSDSNQSTISTPNSGLMKFNRAFALRRARLGMDTCGVQIAQPVAPKAKETSRKVTPKAQGNDFFKRNDGGRFSLRANSQQAQPKANRKPQTPNVIRKNEVPPPKPLTNSQRTIKPVKNSYSANNSVENLNGPTKMLNQQQQQRRITSASNNRNNNSHGKSTIHSDNEIQHSMDADSSCDETSLPSFTRLGRSSLRSSAMNTSSSTPWLQSLKANTRPHTPLMKQQQQFQTSLAFNPLMQKSSSFSSSVKTYNLQRANHVNEHSLGETATSSDCGNVRSFPGFQIGKRFFSTKPHQMARFDRDFSSVARSSSASQSRGAPLPSKTSPEQASLMTHSVTESMLLHHHVPNGSASHSSHDMSSNQSEGPAMRGSASPAHQSVATTSIGSRIFSISSLDSLVISAINQLSCKLRARMIELLEAERSNQSLGSDTRSLIEEILPQVGGLDYRSPQSKSTYNHEHSNPSRDLSNILKNLKKIEQIFDVFHLLLEPSTNEAESSAVVVAITSDSDNSDSVSYPKLSSLPPLNIGGYRGNDKVVSRSSQSTRSSTAKTGFFIEL